MLRKTLIASLAIVVATPATATAPAGTAGTRYCMRIIATGTLLEPIKCWTRDQWVAQGVDIDRDWARNGVRIVG